MLGGEGEVPRTPGSVSQVPDPGKTGPCTRDDVRVNIHPVVYVIRPKRISRRQLLYRLLFNRIDMSSDHLSINEKLEFSTDILAYSAKTHLSLGNVAVSSAGCASDP